MKAARAFAEAKAELKSNRLDEATVQGVIGLLKNTNVMRFSFAELIKGISNQPPSRVMAGLTKDDPADTATIGRRQIEVDATDAYWQIVQKLGGEKVLPLDFQHGLIEFLNNLAKYNKIKNRPVQLPGEGKENRA